MVSASGVAGRSSVTRPVHLGIDIGGTASRWVACAPNGDVLARGSASGATGHIFNPVEKERLRAALGIVSTTLRQSGLHAISVTSGMTGYGFAAESEVKALVGSAFKVGDAGIVLMDDIILAFTACFAPGEGHLISAGTGSIGIHITQSGSKFRVGGRGILIDDAGSGSWIALQALDRIYRVLDHEGSFVSVERLATHLFRGIGGSDWHDVRQFIYGGDRGRIGTLAVAVARAAEEGDETALALLRQAGFELAQLGKALLGAVDDLPLNFIGGVFELHPSIFDEIERSLPHHIVRREAGDAALAAARLQAMRHETAQHSIGWLGIVAAL